MVAEAEAAAHGMQGNCATLDHPLQAQKLPQAS
jgi:hypothetical protein